MRDMDHDTYKNQSLKETQARSLLAPENLPLDLGTRGIITEAKPVMPGVYETIFENPESAIGMEAYIVQKNAAEISSAAKGYG